MQTKQIDPEALAHNFTRQGRWVLLVRRAGGSAVSTHSSYADVMRAHAHVDPVGLISRDILSPSNA